MISNAIQTGNTMTVVHKLKTTDYLNAGNGRGEFQIRMKRGWGLKKYHVVGLKKGLLLLNFGATRKTNGQSEHFEGSIGFGAGLIAGQLGMVIGDALEKASESSDTMADNHFSMYSDDELIGMARSRDFKGSLVCPYDEIISLQIDKTGLLDSFTRGGSVNALIKVRDKTLGSMTWEVFDKESLLNACDFLPAKLGDRATCNIEFDRERMEFVGR